MNGSSLASILFIFFSVSVFGQGIEGKVFLLTDDLANAKITASAQTGVAREIQIFELTTLSQAKRDGDFFYDVRTNHVMSIMSDENGSFKARLAPGTYSIFIIEPKGLYANLINRQNQINPVTVKAGKHTWLTITVDYQANN